ncbi:MAG: diguanylate cyclase [Myxococcaceae bacterium]
MQVVHYLDEAVHRIKAGGADVLLTAASATFDGETLTLKSKELSPQLPVVLVYPPDEEAADEHARNAGADAFLVAPLKRGTVVSCVRTMLRLSQLQATIRQLETDNDKLVAARLQRAPAPVPAPAPAAPAVSNSDREFEFFKRLLLMEVKRSRRYRYPVSFMLVELDNWDERAKGMSADARTKALAELLSVVSSGLRDIDLAMPSSQDRLLVFLPHTPRDGAITVANRILGKLHKLKELKDATGSVGIASFAGGQGKQQISFGTLMKAASDALKRAQAQGGDRVDAGEASKRDRISMG